MIFQRKEAYATVTQNRVRIPLPERMVVDLYFYITRLGFPHPPDEFGRILYNILKTKPLNVDMLRKYASRRGLREDISNLLFRMRGRYPELEIPELEEGVSDTEAIMEEIVMGASS